MKLNLMIGGGVERAGYVNLDSKVYLDGIAEDAEATELIALDIIDYLAPQEVDEVILHWISKLRHGGTLTIGGLDLSEVSRQYAQGEISHEFANILIYGAQTAPWQYRKGATPLNLLCVLLEQKGLKITSKRCESFHWTVKAQRP